MLALLDGGIFWVVGQRRRRRTLRRIPLPQRGSRIDSPGLIDRHAPTTSRPMPPVRSKGLFARRWGCNHASISVFFAARAFWRRQIPTHIRAERVEPGCR